MTRNGAIDVASLVDRTAQFPSHNIRARGARSLVRPSPVERIPRDLTCYVRHDNDGRVPATIGRAVLGETPDSTCYQP